MSASSAVVLLSSGLDSTVNLYLTAKKMNVVSVLTFDYGQRAAQREIMQSREICLRLNLTHKVIELPWFKDFTRSSLVDRNAAVPQGGAVKIDDMVQSLETAKSVWVPNRNGIFLNIAAGVAEGLGARYVVPGFNSEEAMTFPDNSADFMGALDRSFEFSTANHVQVMCHTADKNKTEIVALGRELKVPFELMWPCYFGDEKICRKCESCQRFIRAIEFEISATLGAQQ